MAVFTSLMLNTFRQLSLIALYPIQFHNLAPFLIVVIIHQPRYQGHLCLSALLTV